MDEVGRSFELSYASFLYVLTVRDAYNIEEIDTVWQRRISTFRIGVPYLKNTIVLGLIGVQKRYDAHSGAYIWGQKLIVSPTVVNYFILIKLSRLSSLVDLFMVCFIIPRPLRVGFLFFLPTFLTYFSSAPWVVKQFRNVICTVYSEKLLGGVSVPVHSVALREGTTAVIICFSKPLYSDYVNR